MGRVLGYMVTWRTYGTWRRVVEGDCLRDPGGRVEEPVRLGKKEKELVRAANEIKISQGQDSGDIEPFIGRWGDEDREVCYIISRDAAGGVTIESPPNEVWRTEFRNVRFKENRITFGQFMYTDPDDKYNSIIEKSGHHPSSGIRLETDFEIDRLDQNELIHKISFLSKGMQLTDPNRQIVGVLRRLE